MSDISDELTIEYQSRLNNLAIFHQHMVTAFNDFSFKINQLLSGSEWELEIPRGEECDLQEDFSFHVNIVLRNKGGRENKFELNITFSHKYKSQYFIESSVCGSGKLLFYADSDHDKHNISNLSSLLWNFKESFPPIVPHNISEF